MNNKALNRTVGEMLGAGLSGFGYFYDIGGIKNIIDSNEYMKIGFLAIVTYGIADSLVRLYSKPHIGMSERIYKSIKMSFY